jgi:lysophospholipase L1-like esterase
VFLGDSITGTDWREEEAADAEAGELAHFAMYPDLLAANDAQMWPGAPDLPATFPGFEAAHNVAVGGSISDDLPAQLRALEDALGPGPYAGGTVVAITIGGNDLGESAILPGMGRRTGERVNEHLARVAGWFHDRRRFPDGAWVYVTNVYDPTGPGNAGGACWPAHQALLMDEVIANLNREMRRGAEAEGYAVLDLHGLFEGRGYGRSDPDDDRASGTDPAHWFEDCIHPNARGHHEIRGMFLRAMTGEEP